MLIGCCLKKPNVIHGSEIQDCHLHTSLFLTIDPIGKWIAAFSLKQQTWLNPKCTWKFWHRYPRWPPQVINIGSYGKMNKELFPKNKKVDWIQTVHMNGV